MKKHRERFMKRASIFVVLCIVLFLSLNQIYLSYIFEQKNINRNYNQLVEYDEKSLKILFFGDSHPAEGINPQFINNSFNFAVPSETYEQTYYKVRWALKNYPSVNIFVLPFDIHSFSDYRHNPYESDERYWIQFMSYKELSRLTNKSIINLFVRINFPVIGKGTEIINLIKQKNKTEIYLGWQKNYDRFNSKENTSKMGVTRVNDQLPKYPHTPDYYLVQSFYKTINLLEKYNKTIVLIKYPLTDEYLEAVENKGLNVSEFYSKIEENLKKDKEMIFEYQSSYRHNQTLFSDSDHLNTKGAEMFSKAINKDLNRLKIK